MTTMLPVMRVEVNANNMENQSKQQQGYYDHYSDDDMEDSKPFLSKAGKDQNSKRHSRSNNNKLKGKRRVLQCAFILATILLALLIICPLVYLFRYHISHDENSLKEILIWPERMRDSFSSLHTTTMYCPTSEVSCKVTKYRQTNLVNFLKVANTSDAVVLDASTNYERLPLLPIATKTQCVVYSRESRLPDNFDYQATKSLSYNLTMVNHRQSDISTSMFKRISFNIRNIRWGPYDTMDRQSSVFKRMKAFVAKPLNGKNKMVLIRGCSEKASNFYFKLKQHPAFEDLDMETDCESVKPADPSFAAPYKFYILFEQEYCDTGLSDYFLGALYNGAVPVVFHGPHYKSLAPPDSYIDIGLKDEDKLVSLLFHILQNPDEHLKYLWWTVNNQIILQETPLCQLCEMLYRPSKRPENRQPISHWEATTCHPYVSSVESNFSRNGF